MPFDNPHQVPFSDLEVLRLARQYIDHPSKWMKHRYNDRSRYCIVGALVRAHGSQGSRPYLSRNVKGYLPAQGRRLARRLRREMPMVRRILYCFLNAKASLIVYNDGSGRTHADVMELFDHAIARLEMRCYAGR